MNFAMVVSLVMSFIKILLEEAPEVADATKRAFTKWALVNKIPLKSIPEDLHSKVEEEFDQRVKMWADSDEVADTPRSVGPVDESS